MGRRDGRAACFRIELAEDRRNVVVDGPLRDHEPFGNLGIAKTLRDELQNLELSYREIRRIRSRRLSPPARDRCAQLAQAARHDGRERPCPKSPALGERLQQRALVTSFRERERGLVGAPAARPFIGSASPITGRPERVWVRRHLGHRRLEASQPSPIRQPRHIAGRAPRERPFELSARLPVDLLGFAREPRELGSCSSEVDDGERFFGRDADIRRRIERVPRTGIASP